MFGDLFGQRGDYAGGTFYSGRNQYLTTNPDTITPPDLFKTRRQVRSANKSRDQTKARTDNMNFHIRFHDKKRTDEEVDHHEKRKFKKVANMVRNVISFEHFSSMNPHDWVETREAGVHMWINKNTGEVSTVCPWTIRRDSEDDLGIRSPGRSPHSSPIDHHNRPHHRGNYPPAPFSAPSGQFRNIAGKAVSGDSTGEHGHINGIASGELFGSKSGSRPGTSGDGATRKAASLRGAFGDSGNALRMEGDSRVAIEHRRTISVASEYSQPHHNQQQQQQQRHNRSNSNAAAGQLLASGQHHPQHNQQHHQQQPSTGVVRAPLSAVDGAHGPPGGSSLPTSTTAAASSAAAANGGRITPRTLSNNSNNNNNSSAINDDSMSVEDDDMISLSGDNLGTGALVYESEELDNLFHLLDTMH